MKSRFGNQLLAYFKAQWLVDKYDLPYLHEHFDFDHLLQVNNAHSELKSFLKTHPLAKTIRIKNFDEVLDFISKKHRRPIIFCVDFNSRDDQAPHYHLHEWTEMRENKRFIEKMRNLLSPAAPLDIVEIPENMKSIAVHIRKGGGDELPLWSIQYFDEEILREEKQKQYDYSIVQNHFHDTLRPFKTPPEQYYVDQLNKVMEMYPNENFYVHVFTDDPDPVGLIERLKEKVSARGEIIFNTRQQNNSHDSNVVEDLLSMMNFNVLIRTLSSYSVFSHVLGKHELVIYPKQYEWIGRCLVYTDVAYEHIEQR